MFGILKKKFSQLVESISKKTEEKKEEQIEEKKSWIEKIKEKRKEAPAEEKPLEEKSPELEKKTEVETVKESVKIEIPVEQPKEVEPEVKEEPKEKKSFFKRVTEKIFKTIAEKTLTEEDVNPILNDLETGLMEADTTLEVAEKIKVDLRTSLVGKEIKRGKEKELVFGSLKQSLLSILSVPRIDLEEMIRKSKGEKRPALILFFGTNGVGKSLNLSKMAKYLKDKGHQPMLAAGDTFRAMGSEQLEKYGEMIGVPVISQKRGSDSCAVIFDARKSAEAKGYDVVLADSSGRMHTKKDLLDELEKIVRVNKPDLKILVLDSLSGSDVVLQYEFFNKAVGIDAIFFSKVDVNEKGGNILSMCYSFKVPIIFLGTGQRPEDLVAYEPNKFVEILVGM